MLLGFGLVRRAFGWLWRLTVLVVVVAVGYLAVTAGQVWWASRRNDARPAQAIIVMGAAQYNGVPTPVLVARLTEVLSLWRAHLAPNIVVTGGGQPGDHYTEAEASAAWLEAKGVPASAIVKEVSGRDSYESLAAAASYLVPRKLTTVLLVSDPFHEKRILEMARGLGLVPYPSPTRTSPITGTAALKFFGRETVAVAAGRIVGYRRLSDFMHGAALIAGSRG